jgi:hypothetical protein
VRREQRNRHLRRWLDELIAWLDGADEEPEGPPVAYVAGWVHPLGEEADMGEITVQVGAPAQFASVQWLSAEGMSVAPDAVPSWVSSDEAVATVVGREDGASAEVSFVGAGSAVIEVSTIETNDAGEETTVRATGLVNVDEPDVDAVTGEVTFSTEDPAPHVEHR